MGTGLHGVQTLACHRCGLGLTLDIGIWQGSGHPYKISDFPLVLRLPLSGKTTIANIHAFKNMFTSSMSFLYN